MNRWRRATVLITGGTGTLGRRLVERLPAERRPQRLIVFSRDEHKQHDMRQAGLDGPGIEYRIGDVREARSLREAMAGVDIVVHAAALKQVPLGEAQPMEAILTNVMGAECVIDAALAAGVGHVAALSTDKAVHPVNVYGATKMLAERLFLQANRRRDNAGTRLACIRYGNVLGSRSSLVPILRGQRATGRVTITDPDMTRFWMTLDDAVDFVVRCVDRMRGGEIFVPIARGARVPDIVRAVAPDCAVESIGRRAGERTHELLISDEEAPFTVQRDGAYVIRPSLAPQARPSKGARPFAGTRFTSDAAAPLTARELAALGDGEPATPPLPATRGEVVRRAAALRRRRRPSGGRPAKT